jgi:CheY-like chemotaxis protein
MPVLDGLEAARRIRALAVEPGLGRLAELPIIAMTALAMASDTAKSQEAGMNDHVTKPIDPERLMAVLAKWVRPSGAGERPAAPGQAAPPADDCPPELAALKSLDAHQGIRRIGGKAEAYRRQLRRFREHYPDAAARLERLLADQGTQQAEEYCHQLKGVAGNIGAVPLYESASAVDAQLKQGRRPSAELIEELRGRLAEVMDDIDGLATAGSGEAAAGQPPAAPLDREGIMERLELLAQALQFDLGAAEPLLVELRAGTSGQELESTVRQIASKADVFAIDEALAILVQLQQRLQGDKAG